MKYGLVGDGLHGLSAQLRELSGGARWPMAQRPATAKSENLPRMRCGWRCGYSTAHTGVAAQTAGGCGAGHPGGCAGPAGPVWSGCAVL